MESGEHPLRKAENWWKLASEWPSVRPDQTEPRFPASPKKSLPCGLRAAREMTPWCPSFSHALRSSSLWWLSLPSGRHQGPKVTSWEPGGEVIMEGMCQGSFVLKWISVPPEPRLWHHPNQSWGPFSCRCCHRCPSASLLYRLFCFSL